MFSDVLYYILGAQTPEPTSRSQDPRLPHGWCVFQWNCVKQIARCDVRLGTYLESSGELFRIVSWLFSRFKASSTVCVCVFCSKCFPIIQNSDANILNVSQLTNWKHAQVVLSTQKFVFTYRCGTTYFEAIRHRHQFKAKRIRWVV